MIIERSMNDAFRSNTFLVCDEPGGEAVFVDAGGPVAPLLEAADRFEVDVTNILLTHHHLDHVDELGALTARWPKAAVRIHPLERELISSPAEPLEAGERLSAGRLAIRPLHTPGHTAGMLSFLIEHSSGSAVFTGDTLFRDSVGGVRAPGHTTYQALKDSIMGTLMELPRQTEVQPGHSEPTTIEREWEHNPFIRLWRGLDREGTERCTVQGDPATLILLALDYDGGHKAWVRWPDGADDIVPGSWVARAG